MSRSGYCENYEDNWALIRWRGAVKSAIKGRRGQALLREMLAALNALPDKRLIIEELIIDGERGGLIVGGDELVMEDAHSAGACRIGDVCALGAVAVIRKMETSGIDPHDPDQVAPAFEVSKALVCEIAYINDANATFFPLGELLPQELKLRGFSWRDHMRVGSNPSLPSV